MKLKELVQQNGARELTFDQLDQVSGGAPSVQWGVSTGVAAAFTVGAATVSAPLVAGALAMGGVVAAGMAVYYAISEDGDQATG